MTSPTDHFDALAAPCSLFRAVALSTSLVAAVAWPCSGPPCSAIVEGVPRSGSTIPANAPAVGVQRALFSSNAAVGGTSTLPPSSQAISLRRTDGGLQPLTPLAATYGTFGSTAAFTPGSEWELEFTESWAGCGGVTSRFTIGPSAPVPTSSATIALLDSTWVDASNSSCGASPEVQLARLRITPTTAMEPWLALARWELEVDGRLAGTAAYGTIPAGAFEPEATQGVAFRPVNVVQVECQAAPGGPGFAPGLHQVRVVARIEGFSSPIASNSLSVQIDCIPGGTRDGGPVLVDDGGAPDAGRDAGDQSGPDAGRDAGDQSGPDGGPDAGRDAGDTDGDAGPIIIDGGTGIASGPTPPSGCSAAPMISSLALALLARRLRRRS